MAPIGRIRNLSRQKITLGVILVASVVLMGAQGGCPMPGTLKCRDIGSIQFSVIVPRGGCTRIDPNPCTTLSGQTLNAELGDFFDLESTGIDGITSTVILAGSPPQVERQICASLNAPLLVNQPLGYTYTRGSDWGVGTVFLTVQALTVTINSNSPIDLGSGTTLYALVSGGLSPYSYSWSPAATLSAANIANPIATPLGTTTYTVVVTDAKGASGSASFTVVVNNRITALKVTATPPVLGFLGQTSQLNVMVTGGTPPYLYSWTPTASLVGANTANPIATPTSDTIYTVVVIDSDIAGSGATGTVRVTIGGGPFTPLTVSTVSATPQTLSSLGGTSQLNVVVSGGVPPYSYSWTPTARLSGANTQNPVAFPASNTSYMVVVTDTTGATATGSVPVTIGLPPGSPMTLTVSASPPLFGPAGQTSQLNVMVLGGTPSYTYSWTPAASLSAANIQNPVATLVSTTIYTVIVTDATGATATGKVIVAPLGLN